MEYTVDYFIEKFEAIPEDGMGSHGLILRCALYHCGVTYDGNKYLGNEEQSVLSKLFAPLWRHENGLKDDFEVVASVNDGDHPNYQQPTPKQRILAALYDIKAKSEKPIIPVFTSMIKKHEAEAVYYAREIARSLLVPREKEKV